MDEEDARAFRTCMDPDAADDGEKLGHGAALFECAGKKKACCTVAGAERSSPSSVGLSAPPSPSLTAYC